MYMNAYHKVQGEVRMFEVDARNAIARYPEEWSAEPWPTEDADNAEISVSKRERRRKMEGKPPEEPDNAEGAARNDAIGD